MGIATLYVDNFSGRGVKHTYKDQTKATVWGQVIDIFYGFNFLKAHQKVNKNKIGITGNSRGGSVAWMVLDKRINDIFLNQGEQFAASMPIAHQCDMGQQFKNPIPTKTTVLNVHGGADNYTIPEPCIEYEKQIFRPEVKKVGGSSSSYIGKGWYHSFFANWEAEYYRYLVTFGKHKEGIRCPLNYTTDEGYSPDEMTN